MYIYLYIIYIPVCSICQSTSVLYLSYDLSGIDS